MVAPDLALEINRLHAEFCSAIADPTRLILLYTLAGGSHNVSELTRELDLPQPSVSRHLKILRERGLVVASRQGSTVQYDLGDRRVIDALDILRSIMRDRIQFRASLVGETEEE